VFVGEAVQQFDYTFDGEEPLAISRFCVISEQIRPEDDTLHIGVEILEATIMLESHSSLAAMGAQELEDENEADDGSMFIFHRHLSHQTLDLVQNQVDVMNSRMTRTVEWRLERASRLPNSFAQGESMCSTTFQAAGLDGLQFVFYPSGSFGAKEGYCSCFLFYSGRAALKCWLSVGKQRREAKISFSSAGFFGRTNFCPMDMCIDSSDAVMLSVEIESAQQEVTRFSSNQRPQSTSNLSPTGTANLASPTGDASASGDADSTLKMQNRSGHLLETKRLPSIWSPAPRLQMADALEGFRNTKDLPAKGRQSSRAPPPSTVSPDIPKVRPGTVSSMSMYSQSDRDPSRPESRQRPGSRFDRAASPSDRQGAMSTLSMYSDVQPCPPASARPTQRSSARDILSSKYAPYTASDAKELLSR
jgi:hypothetical protein